MIAYIIRRLLIFPLTITAVTILIFGMISLLTPYERASLYVSDIPKRPGEMDEIIKKYGLDDPVPLQYWYWLVGKPDVIDGSSQGGILQGKMGWSKTGKSWVSDAIAHRLPATAELALWAVVPMIGLGLWFGVLSALHHNRLIDQVLRIFSIVGWSIPTFVFGLVVLMIFYARLGWFPPGRLSDWAMQVVQSGGFIAYTGMHTVDAIFNVRLDVFWDALQHLVLPVTTLAYLNCAYMLRVTRSSMLDTLMQDYMTTARAKGMAETTVIRRHALPNALIPVITVGALVLIGLLNGVVITETVYNLPGMGSLLAEAALSLDIVTVLGIALFNCVILIGGNLIVDILYGVVDPRIRLQ